MREKHHGKFELSIPEERRRRPSWLEDELMHYGGDDEYLVAIRDKMLGGRDLTAQESGKAGELMSFTKHRERATAYLLAKPPTPDEVCVRLRTHVLNGGTLTRTHIAELRAHLKSRGKRL